MAIREGIRSIETAEVFEPLLVYHRYKGVHGGRGGAKSWFVAGYIIESHLQEVSDTVCLREVQKSLKFSSKKTLETMIVLLNAGDYFDIQDKVIKVKHGGIIIFEGMQDHNADSIKSLEGFKRAWFEEAQNASQRSLELLRPTIRLPGSEVIFTWNRFKEDDPVEILLCGDNPPDDCVVVESNLDDNPFAPAELLAERENDRRLYDKDKFDNIWGGKFLKNSEGDYYKNELAAMEATNRVCRIPALEIPVNTFWDIGNSDGCSVWFHQKVGLEHRIIGYYEAHNEVLSHYVRNINERKYDGTDHKFIYNKHFFPHDADHKRLSDTNRSTKEMMEDLGMTNIQIVPPCPTLQRGIDITRKNFPYLYIDSDLDGDNGCKAGLKRIANYRKKYSSREKRWLDEPNKSNGCSEAADALRQWAQAVDLGMVETLESTTSTYLGRPDPDWRL